MQQPRVASPQDNAYLNGAIVYSVQCVQAAEGPACRSSLRPRGVDLFTPQAANENEQGKFTAFDAADSFSWPGRATAGRTAGGSASSAVPRVKLSILMPAYNEENTVGRAVAEILTTDYPCDIELIVVDDGSTDQTAVLLSAFRDDRLIVHRHPVNRGKGAALRSAADLATGTHLLPFDADLEYAAEDIPRMLEPVLKARSDVVYGARLFGVNTAYQSYRYALGNRMLTTLANLFFNASLSDMHTCLKLMPAATVKQLGLSEIGFGLDTEMTALLLLRGVRPFEVPVSYYGRTHADGKKINWRDAVRCVWILLRVRFRGRSGCRGTAIDDQEEPG